jgi:hypothetical protein
MRFPAFRLEFQSDAAELRACRAWSYQVAGGDLAVLAAAYAYLVRQLRFRDVDPDIVLALLESIKEAILNSD